MDEFRKQPLGEKGRGLLRSLLPLLQWGSLVMSLLLALLIAQASLQRRRVRPGELPALEKLLAAKPEGETAGEWRQTVRDLDLMARSAYFTNIQFRRRLTLALAVFLAMFLVSAKLKRRLLDRETPRPAAAAGAGEFTRHAVIGLTLALGVFAVALPWVAPLPVVQRLLRRGPGAGSTAAPAPLKPLDRQTDWPAFRGFGGRGHAYVESPPLTWNVPAGTNVVWTRDLPLPGYNSPIIIDGVVYLSGADKEKQSVFAFNAVDGEPLWTADVPVKGPKRPQVTPDTGLAAPTMTGDGRYVFVVFAGGDLAALNREGQIVWQAFLGVPTNHYGHSSSLITHNGTLYVQFDSSGNAGLYAYDALTGKVTWRVKREVDISWASPVWAEHEGTSYLLLNAAPHAAVFRPGDGERLYTVSPLDGEIGASPAYADGVAYFGNEYSSMYAVRVSDGKKLWDVMDGLPETSSPAATAEYFFMASSYGMVSCLNAKTGKPYWRKEISQAGFYSSPIIAAGRVYLMARDGVMNVFRADKTYRLLAGNPTGEKVDTTPAFSGKRLFLRTPQKLICIGPER